MRYAVLALLVLSCAVYAKQRTVVVKMARPDTTVVIKQDTVVTTDTLVVTQTWQDTSFLVKSDTAKISHKKEVAAPKKK
jgi:predicted unusual protein kinase regulating ubiquinone biosynthesis (AarF/ABC1/UbiB family)